MSLIFLPEELKLDVWVAVRGRHIMCTFLCHLDVLGSVCIAWLSFGQDFLVNMFCPGIG